MKTKLMTVAVATAMAAGAAGAATLDDVKAAGSLKCGVSQGLPGFSATNDAGEWTGIDVDYCKALAAAFHGLNGGVHVMKSGDHDHRCAREVLLELR